MNLTKDIINSAVEKQFTSFSDSIKSVLHAKMVSHECAKAYVSTIDVIRDEKKAYNSINDSN